VGLVAHAYTERDEGEQLHADCYSVINCHAYGNQDCYAKRHINRDTYPDLQPDNDAAAFYADCDANGHPDAYSYYSSAYRDTDRDRDSDAHCYAGPGGIYRTSDRERLLL